MKKILSVSVAAYNVETTLRESIDPFIQSGVLDLLDIMIVDDGSKDNTAKIAQEYQDRFPESIHLIQKVNGGWGSTVNTGIQNAIGKYFKQLDGDDYFNPENLPRYLELLEEYNSDLIITPYVTYDDLTKTVISTENCNPGCPPNTELELKNIDSFGPFMHSFAIKTELLKHGKVVVTEHCFYTDTEFVLKSCNQADTVMFLDMPIYYYRRASSGQSMSLDGLEKHYMEQYKVIEVSLDYLHTSVTREEIRRIYDNLLFGTCFWQYLIMMYISTSSQHKKDLIAYDNMLKKKAPEYYKKISFPELDLLRKFHFIGYTYLATQKKKRDNRFTEDGRLAN